VERFIEEFVRDRRLSLRYKLRTLLRVRVRRTQDAEQQVESENLSQRGVFFATGLQVTEGAPLDLLLEMPGEVTGMPPAHWLCVGHVVRVVETGIPKGMRGVGVQFDFYEVAQPQRERFWSLPVGLRGPAAALAGR